MWRWCGGSPYTTRIILNMEFEDLLTAAFPVLIGVWCLLPVLPGFVVFIAQRVFAKRLMFGPAAILSRLTVVLCGSVAVWTGVSGVEWSFKRGFCSSFQTVCASVSFAWILEKLWRCCKFISVPSSSVLNLEVCRE